MERLGWCLEFVLRHSSLESEHVKELVKLSSVTEIDNRKMKMLLLNFLEDELLSKASTPEWMLEILEVFEKLLLHDWDPSNPNPNPISDSMKSAYRIVAVECTVKYLEAEAGTSNPKHYLQAVERIWKRRFQKLEGSYLLTPELRDWKRLIDGSLFNQRYMLKLASFSESRRTAIQGVQLFLKDARNNLLGPSFLHSVAAATSQNQSHNGYFFFVVCLLPLYISSYTTYLLVF